MFEGVVDVECLVEAHAGKGEDFECFKGLLHLVTIIIMVLEILVVLVR